MQEFANEMYGAYGGNLSVRRPVDSKPLLIFGQDESIFNQFSFGSKQWVGLSGQSLVTKCISRDLLTTDRIHKFSRRARSYMVTYSSLQFIQEDKGQEQVMMNNTFIHTKLKT